LSELVAAVGRADVVFATMRPQGSQFATLDRRVVVVDPPELKALAESGDLAVVEELVELLRDRDRAWPALVLLAAMTGREEKLVESFQDQPDWWDVIGRTAHHRWRTWLDEARDGLVWDPAATVFTARSGPL
jgi:hypothetical protein